ncbi:DUF6807 domain-containing protein [Algoriphagus machipongonensis]|uniref:Methane oxygenase PmoA n=1 Tax=Algoriphagus machipongonensis TaxID=388413 RepID=A3HSI1_9BACT|nr:PmoA family protein [Algoriphagus machipongonensis]EAZ82799.1 hypothetical protein ALPR1_11300 [Algoriphagus machipongonensis]
MYFTQINQFLILLLLGFTNSPINKTFDSVINNSKEVELKNNEIKLVDNTAEKKVDVLVDGELFTSFIYPDTLDKPVLFPINSSQGTTITRGWPLDPKPGERFDHPHHIGLWFNYGDVNGIDFWNNSYAIPEEKKSDYGHITLKSIDEVSVKNNEGKLSVTMEWKNHTGDVLLVENTTFIFKAKDSERIIERTSTLTAADQIVRFTDNKEGMLAIRMARELEHPATKPELFTDASGKVTDVPVLNNEGVTGMYTSSNGKKGDDVWGTRGDWVDLEGEIDGEKISVVIYDHPKNVGYPTYWHARGYGLFAANPLGQKAMSLGKEELNYQLNPGESMTFKFKIDILNDQNPDLKSIESTWKKWKKTS